MVFKNLSPGAVGIRGLSLAGSIDLASKTGFAGIDFSIREAAQLADQHDVAYVQELFRGADILAGQWGLPVVWNKEEDEWQQGLSVLPALATLGQALGCTRTATWCLSGSNERSYDENWQWHVDRFRPIAEILADHGCRLGIEFIGPKTIRDRFEYEFVYSMEGMLDLADAIGTGNVGLLLDAWHLYTSGGSIDDMDKLENEDIVTVHVNDAPEGVPVDEQIDNVRRLPMETGVIDLPGFMKKLAALDYDGPVTAEPFSERVNALEDPVEAARLTAEHMDRMWKAAGLE
jgi:sugar phosphate isomerase/epimerase